MELSILDVKGNKVSDGFLKSISGLPENGDHLFLEEKPDITDDGLMHLTEMRQLSSLYLNHTQITDNGLKHLYSITSLSKVTLTGSQVTEVGVHELREELPECSILWEE